jgi:GNAT superfamily N-acetyltransferase
VAIDSTPDFPTNAELPAIPGLRFRHFAGAPDYPAMNDAANDARIANRISYLTPVEDFVNSYEHLDAERCDLHRDLVIVDIAGVVAGYGRTEWEDTAHGRVHYVICFLRPAWRRRGIGRALLETLEARATAVAATQAFDGPRYLQADAHEDPGANALLESAGYEAVRYFFVMVRPHLDPVPDAPMPEGLEIRPVREEHIRRIWEAGNEAASETWEYSEPTEADYEEFLSNPVEGDRTLWQVAWDGDEIAGQVRPYINRESNERLGLNRGWVENILVRRPWRRRGLARALIDASVAALRERGMTEGILGVDAENESGALRLYRSVGFEIESREIVYRKPLPLPGPS